MLLLGDGGDTSNVDFEERGLQVLRGDDGQKKKVVLSGYYRLQFDDEHRGRGSV